MRLRDWSSDEGEQQSGKLVNHKRCGFQLTELFKNVRLGFGGYRLQQLTNHEINGVAIPNSKERTVGHGPGIQVGGQGIWFRVNSYIETDVIARAGSRLLSEFQKRSHPTNLTIERQERTQCRRQPAEERG